MRSLILLPLLLLIDWFAFQALQLPLSSVASPWHEILVAVYWIIPFATLVYATAAQTGRLSGLTRRTRVTLTALIFILYLSKFLTGTIILLDDVRRMFAWIGTEIIPGAELLTGRMPLMQKIALILGGIPASLLIYGLVRNPYRYKVFSSDIAIDRLPEGLEGLRIVQISDIHTGSLTDKERVAASVRMINDLEPDIVFFTGDLVNNVASEADPFIPVFSKIKARHGVFSVLGNHDYGDYVQWPNRELKVQNLQALKDQHGKLGWDLLLNTHRTLHIDGHTVGVVGVENYSASPRFAKYGDMTEATRNMPVHDVTILLSHDPSHWEDEVLSRYPQVDLTLSGHTHGFQFGVELGKYIKWSPVKYVYKQWAGLYERAGQYLYVNRGLGFLGYPGRVGILPEISLLTLRSK